MTKANENKTVVTAKDPLAFIDEWVEDSQKRRDSLVLIDMMQKITGHKPKMWGPTMIGFGLMNTNTPVQLIMQASFFARFIIIAG